MNQKSDATQRFLAAVGETEQKKTSAIADDHPHPRERRGARSAEVTRAVSDYKTARQVAAMLHYDPKTIRTWIRRFHLGKRHGVYKPAGKAYLFHWPTFEREFVQRQGADEP
jgi:hypothetical protein